VLVAEKVIIAITVESHDQIKQECSSVLERVGQLATGGDDRGYSSIFVFVSTDFRCGATF